MSIRKKNNLLIDKHPDLLNEWDYTKNNADNIDVNNITYGSHVKANWICNTCKGKYKMMVKDRTHGHGCPYCAGKKVLKGFNDFASCCPDLLNEWDYELNDKKGLQPDEITYGSKTKASWHCKTCNGYYEMTVNHRTSGHGCPYCAGMRVLTGFNDLQTKYPDLIDSEWDWIMNDANDLHPDAITSGSTVKAWWHCNSCDGRYEMRVNSKTSGHQGCPYCSGRKALAGFNDLASQYPDLISKEWDYESNNKKGLKPDDITSCSQVEANWHCNTCKGKYKMMVEDKIYGYGCPYCICKQVLKGYNDLASQYPDLISKEWDYESNNKKGLEPDEITYGSKTKASWRCDTCKHEYEMQINDKTNGMRCPSCLKHKVLIGYNDLLTKYPELIANEWDYEKNNENDLKPYAITSHSNIKANWHCNTCKGKYEMIVNHKTLNKQGCPYCAGKRVLIGYNDLALCYPDLITNAWDWVKNNQIGLKPDEITSGVIRKAYWKCSKCSHEWCASIKQRTSSDKTGCPKCSHRISNQENQVAEYITDYISNYASLHNVNIAYTVFRSIKFKRIYEMLSINSDDVLSDGLQSHLRKELDIYIPELGLAVEYDGDYWHNDKLMIETRGLTNSEAHQVKTGIMQASWD